MGAATAQEQQTYVVRIDLDGQPLIRQYANAASDAEALAATQEQCDDKEVAAEAVPLQPILDRVIERIGEGVSYSVSFKHEDETDEGIALGPVWIVDLDALRAEAEKQNAIREDGAIILSRPFGTVPDYETPLPWMDKRDAKRLAKYVGVPLGES